MIFAQSHATNQTHAELEQKDTHSRNIGNTNVEEWQLEFHDIGVYELKFSSFGGPVQSLLQFDNHPPVMFNRNHLR